MLQAIKKFATHKRVKDTTLFALLFTGGEVVAHKQKEYYAKHDKNKQIPAIPSIEEINKCGLRFPNSMHNKLPLHVAKEQNSKWFHYDKTKEATLFNYNVMNGNYRNFSVSVKSFDKDHHNSSNALATTISWAIPSGLAISHWYSFLDNDLKKTAAGKWASKFGKVNPATKLSSGLIWFKITLDLLADIPIYGSYIAAQRQFGGADKSNPFSEVFTKMYLTDLCFWIPANTINFFKVSPTYRVPFYAAAVFVWSIILPVITKE